MTNEEFRAAIRDLGLTNRAAALLCGVHPVTLKRWLSGKWPVPQHATTIVRQQAQLRTYR